ncbi:MAG: MBL fold metallo-hydrolase [Pseudomonadota bacterium]
MTRKLGDKMLTMFNAGTFRLDGGAMHGVVPKTIWSQQVSCDDRNRVAYATNVLLVETGSHRLLVETGNGDKYSPKEREIYGFEAGRSLATALVERAVDPESIDVVVLTHLHFDHAGGATYRTEDGRLVPLFPRARHVVQRRELEAALHPHERNRASYLADNVNPLLAANLFDIVEGEIEVLPGIRVVPTPGHTHGHQSVVIDGGGTEKAVFLGDVVPTSVHVRLPVIMAYDLEVEASLASKKRILGQAIAEGWLVLWGHDKHHGGFVVLDERGQPRVDRYVEI